MFEISPSAAEVIRRMTCAVPGVEGVRIAQAPAASSNGSAPQICVVVAPAAGPLDDDRTLMEDGVAVFVDCAIAAMLDDKRLEVVPAGADQLQFTLTDQQLP